MNSLAAVYINLEARADRRAHMEQLLLAHGWAGLASRFVALTPADADVVLADRRLFRPETYVNVINTPAAPRYAEIEGRRYKLLGGWLTPGALGCAASHTTLWNWSRENDRPVLILEDDIEVLPSPPKLNDYLADAPADADLLMLGWHGEELDPGAGKWQPPGAELFGLFGYIVTPKGASRLLEQLLPVEQQIDTAVNGALPTLSAWWLSARPIVAPTSAGARFGTDVQAL